MGVGSGFDLSLPSVCAVMHSGHCIGPHASVGCAFVFIAPAGFSRLPSSKAMGRERKGLLVGLGVCIWGGGWGGGMLDPLDCAHLGQAC